MSLLLKLLLKGQLAVDHINKVEGTLDFAKVELRALILLDAALSREIL